MAINRIARLLLTGLFMLSLFALWGRSTVGAKGNALDDTGQADLAAISSTPVEPVAKETAPISFLVILDDQLDADTLLDDQSGHLRAADHATKADAIYHPLTARATLTQAPLRAWLDARGVAYEPVYIVNMIEVRGDAQLAQALRQRRCGPARRQPCCQRSA